jgi:formylglycine-generating enzyme required for sulfatase activity
MIEGAMEKFMFFRRRTKKWTLTPLIPFLVVLATVLCTSSVHADQPFEITGKDGAPMVLVPAGKFLYGNNKEQLSLPAFYMDKFEVTTKLYAQFIQAASQKQPEFWNQVSLTSVGDRPVMGVKWSDADAYCRYYGKRLPTEQEWEKAARGTDGRTYPWGNEQPSSRYANFLIPPVTGKNPSGNFYNDRLTAVGNYEADKSPYGIYDMAGNVREWTDSNHENGGKVLRGGAYSLSVIYLRSTKRIGIDPKGRDHISGFRCAQAVLAGGNVLAQAPGSQAPTTDMRPAQAPPASEEATISVEELYSSVKQPTTPLELLQNIKVVLDHDLLLREDFYTENNLKRFFAGQKVVLRYGGSRGENPSVSVSQFGSMVESVKSGGLVLEGIQFNFRRTVQSDNHVKAYLYFAVLTSDISFANVEQVFGTAWKYDYRSPHRRQAPPSPTLPQGNARISYTVDHAAAKGRVDMEFHADATLYVAEIVEERR